jgi:8-oxo-dGTP pyrophosphatase MutT (NUDIX family)
MDISIILDGIKFNLRTAVIIETEKGFVFEKNTSAKNEKDRFYFVVGGRIIPNESSEEAAKREIEEELGIKIGNIKIKAIVESFFELENIKYHEICFYYKYKINGIINVPENYYVFSKEEMKTKIIKPIIINDIINSKNNDILHIVLNENV